jgi:ubiquinone/menaquinone biosynthesis C-methylase UbiE
MTGQQGDGQGPHATSTGHAQSEAGWLDAHFETARREYEAMARVVGIRPGWRVLDAGCGSGAFLPLLAELVGPQGQLTALDLAPENVAAVQGQAATWNLPCPVNVRVGSVLALPFPDASFDAVWCANTSQYLTDDELATALAELRRVVRPGGLVAVKEFDAALVGHPTRDPFLTPAYYQARYRAGEAQARGMLRGPALRAWLVRAGLADVEARSWLIERRPPYRDVERQFLVSLYRVMAERAAAYNLPPEDVAAWAWLRDHGEAWATDPAHFYREGAVLVVGRVPG